MTANQRAPGADESAPAPTDAIAPTDATAAPVVLVVDDVPANLGVLFEYLDNRGFQVLIAEDGESALQQARYARPDIILLDMMMPGIDGLETCTKLRQAPETADIPVIFMTALNDSAHKVEGFRAGAVDYVTKPFQHEEVLARIETHLQVRGLQRELKANNQRLRDEVEKRRAAQAALQERVAELQESNAELDAYARTVAHDLKDPLSQILGCVQLIDADEPTPDDARYVALIEKVGLHMSRIIDELLLLARIRDEDVNLQPVHMGPLIDHCQTRLAHLVDQRGGALAIPDSWPVALGYGPWVEEIWVNYISNAIKYGGRPPQVELGATVRPDGRLRYWVRDNGAGVADEIRSSVFREFPQLAGPRPDGHGLGLAIVKRIANKLGGTVGFDSRPGRGSTFYFELAPA